jgi:hypothetical protein
MVHHSEGVHWTFNSLCSCVVVVVEWHMSILFCVCAGYVCPPGIGFGNQYKYVCPGGYICQEGTPKVLATRNVCPVGSYCPSITWRNGSLPAFYRRLKLPAIYSLGMTDEKVLDMPFLQVTCPPIPTAAKSTTLEKCGWWIDTLVQPNGYIEYHFPGTCLRGCTSKVQQVTLLNCYPDNLNSSLVSFSPINLTVVDSSLVYTENPPLLRSGMFTVSPFFFVKIDCDWRMLPSNWTYGLAGQYNITFISEAFYTEPSLGIFWNKYNPTWDTAKTPVNFEIDDITKASRFSFYLLPFVMMSWNMMVNVIHGNFVFDTYVDCCCLLLSVCLSVCVCLHVYVDACVSVERENS